MNHRTLVSRFNLFVASLLVASWTADPAIPQQTRIDPLIPLIDSDSDDGLPTRDKATGRGDEKRQSKKRGSDGAGSKLGSYTTPPPANDVPRHPFDIILGRLTDRSVTVRVLCYDDAQAVLNYRGEAESKWSKTGVQNLKANEPADFVIDSLRKDERYFYRLHYETKGGEAKQSDEYTFHTQRAPGRSFTFTVQADSHLGENTSGEVYLRTLANALSDRPDLHFELGDAFMTGKYVRPEISLGQYLAQRYYVGHLCHSAPFYFVLGNHDGESGSRGSILWATQTRKRYFPPSRFCSLRAA